MISLLSGILIDASPNMVVLDVHGVGFELGISHTTAASLPALGTQCRLYTKLQVREDSLSLFGFADRDERIMFERLVAVTGVGPRLALGVLSKFTPSQLYAIVMAEDDKSMSSVSGVGKKTAQRLILELKSVFSKDAGWRPEMPEGIAAPSVNSGREAGVTDDARAALLSMGFSSQETELALDGIDATGMRVEALLAAALKRLGMES